MMDYLDIIIPIVLVVVCIILFVTVGYLKAPPDQAFIISGLRRRTVIGKATFKIPFFERCDRLNLKMISIDVKTDDFVPNKEFINVKVDAAVKVRVGSSAEMLERAAKNFLNKDESYIVSQVVDALQGNMREIIGQMDLSQMVNDRKIFGEKVKDNAVPDLENMGLEIVSFNIQNFIDEKGVINDLGIDNVSQIRKNAAIAKANAEKEIAIAEAQAAKESNDAKVISEKEIAKNNTELAMEKSALKYKSDIKQAEADSAYKIEEERQRKAIETQKAEANIERQRKEVEFMKESARTNEQQLYSDVKLPAEAQKYKTIQDAEAEVEAARKKAEAIKIIGEAEAEVIRAKGIAEAEGIDKKAEAMTKYGQAAIAEMYFNILPEVAKQVAAPMGNIDKITMYGEGNTAKLIEDITKATSQVQTGLLEGMGIDLSSLLSGMLGGKIVSNNHDCPTQETITKKEG